MKTSRIIVIASLAAAAGVWLGFRTTAAARDTISIADDSFAAIAYSPATGKYGLAYNCDDRSSAESGAIADCGAEDAVLACWVQKGFCALALGTDKSCWGVGWSFGNGASTTAARKFALDDCRKRTAGAHIEAYLSSDGQVVWKRTLDAEGNGQIWISPDTFAAIAYSPAAGKYGIAYDRLSREAAENDALGHCNEEDARIVCWVNRGICALALGPDKAYWGSGWSQSNNVEAKQAALADYRGKTSGGAHIEVVMSSDGQILWEQSKHTTIIGPSGEVILPTGERLFPSGEVILPSGERIFPSGEVILPSGERIYPLAGTTLPSGVKVLPDGVFLLPSGDKVRIGRSSPSTTKPDELPVQDKPNVQAEGATTKTLTAEEAFKSYDANGDGLLTREELIANPSSPSMPKPVWERIVENFMRKDTNGDGKLTLEEWKTPPPPRKKPGAATKT